MAAVDSRTKPEPAAEASLQSKPEPEPSTSGCRKAKDSETLATGVSQKMEGHLKEFVKFLTTAFGGARSLRTAKLHYYHVRRIARFLQENRMGNPEDLLRHRYIADNYLEPMFKQCQEDKIQAGTLLARLCSYRLYLKFVLHNCDANDGERIITITRAFADCESLAKAYKSTRRVETFQRILEEETLELPCELVEKWNNIQGVNVQTMIEDITAGRVSLNQHNHSIIRNYLMARLGIENASRPSGITNLTVRDFTRAVQECIAGKQDRLQEVTLTVLYHKTVVCHGPQQLIVTPALFELLAQYFIYIRSKVPDVPARKTDNGNVCAFFCVWPGSTARVENYNLPKRAIPERMPHGLQAKRFSTYLQ
ncbi:MAG: hypothetical protein MJA29_02140, partial [Candidatus Omnitrophica bacterium]|nr:hypothetical protein [Candidatus Omnitrophota bacterium]